MERVYEQDVVGSTRSSNTYYVLLERNLTRNVIVSPSLVYQGDFSDPLPEGFDAIYMHLLKENGNNKVVNVISDDTEFDDILIQASQLNEASASMGVER